MKEAVGQNCLLGLGIALATVSPIMVAMILAVLSTLQPVQFDFEEGEGVCAGDFLGECGCRWMISANAVAFMARWFNSGNLS